MSVDENKKDSIVCKLEFVGISTLLRFLHSSNANNEMILMFDGIEISLTSRLTNRRLSNSSLFSSFLPSKYLSSLKTNLLFNGEILIFFQLACFSTPFIFQFFQTRRKINFFNL